LFTVEDGKIRDDHLHGEIIGAVEHADASEIGRELERKAGPTEQELMVLYGPTGNKPSSP
jgi:hypothetical protein